MNDVTGFVSLALLMGLLRRLMDRGALSQEDARIIVEEAMLAFEEQGDTPDAVAARSVLAPFLAAIWPDPPAPKSSSAPDGDPPS